MADGIGGERVVYLEFGFFLSVGIWIFFLKKRKNRTKTEGREFFLYI
jgi:hypothetical protein